MSGPRNGSFAKRISLLITVAGFVLFHLYGQKKPQPYEESSTTGHLVNPARLDFSESRLNQLKVPQGFTVGIFRSDVAGARMMAQAPDGSIFVTRPDTNDVIRLEDRDGDGRAELMEPLTAGIDHVHGIAIHKDKLYLAGVKTIYVTDIAGGRIKDLPKPLLSDLPDGAQHPNRVIAVGPDEMLYVAIGSTCNSCIETNKESAAIVRVSLDGKTRAVFANGLRDTLGMDWHPQTSALWAVDMGADWRGNEIPPDELNEVVYGADYGWPFCYGDRLVDKHISKSPKGETREAYCAKTKPPALTFPAHSSPIGFLFYEGQQFPQEYRESAFVALRGSWNRKPPIGYKVARVIFREGRPVSSEDFLTGFLQEDGKAYLGRVAGLCLLNDGSLLVSDDANGVIYRVSYGSNTKRLSQKSR